MDCHYAPPYLCLTMEAPQRCMRCVTCDKFWAMMTAAPAPAAKPRRFAYTNTNLGAPTATATGS